MSSIHHASSASSLPPKPPPKTYLNSPSFTLQKSSNSTLPRSFANPSHASAISECLEDEALASAGHQHQQQSGPVNRNVRANSVCSERRPPSISGMDAADSASSSASGASSGFAPTPSMLRMASVPGTSVSQFSDHLAKISDPRLDSLSSDAARRAPSWADTQDRKQLKRCSDKLVKRCNFIYELVSTEMNHLRNLCVLRAVFRDPLRLFAASILDRQEVDKLFPYLDELERLHADLLDDLRRCEPPQDKHPAEWPVLAKVGAVLRLHLAEPKAQNWLRAYGGFCSQHTLYLQKAVAAMCLRNQEFGALIRECERCPLAGRKALQDYYLMLTQRLSKYKTLFPQISEYCQVAPEDPDMPKACQDLDKILEGVNSEVERCHNSHLLSQIVSNFQPSPEHSPLSAAQLSSRRLLHSGQLKLQTQELKAPVQCFAVLLNDMLVFLQELPGGRYSPLPSPSRHVPVLQFTDTDAIVRENETGKSKATFFVVIKKPDPALLNISCMSLEDRNKWLKRINQVRDSNPRADERALEAERRLREKARVSAELLLGMEAKDRDLRGIMNEKSQLWQQLLSLWGSLESAPLPDEAADPDQLCRAALSQLDNLRRVLHSAGAPDAAAAAASCSSSSLTRSASNAEDSKPPGTVALPKRADTFSGYDSKQQQQPRPSTPTRGDDSEEGPDSILLSQAPVAAQQAVPQPAAAAASKPPGGQAAAASPGVSGSASSLGVKARRKSVAADSTADTGGQMHREKNRRPSVFELVFNRRPRDPSSVSEDSGSEQELRQPDASGLECLDQLHSLVTAMCRSLMVGRTRLAERVESEARLREELEALKASRETEGHRSQDALLETIRLQRAELEQDRARFRDERMRDAARLETRKEELERKEELLRQRQEDLERQLASLTEQKRTLQLQMDQYRSPQHQLLQHQHVKSFSDDFSDSGNSLGQPQQPQQPQLSPLLRPHPPTVVVASSFAVPHPSTANSLSASAAKGHSRSASNLTASAAVAAQLQQQQQPQQPQQQQMPVHLTSRLVEDRQMQMSRENGGLPVGLQQLPPTSRLPHQLMAAAAAASASSAAQHPPPAQLPLHLASDHKKRKSTSVLKVLRRNGESDPAVH